MGFTDPFDKILKTDIVTIDNFVFRLHYGVTAVLILTLSVLTTSKQFFGDPINCATKDDIPKQFLDSFCLTDSLFLLSSNLEKKAGIEVPYPGIGKDRSDEEHINHSYYQWVWLVLYLQAMLFYVPRYIWKVLEGRKIEKCLEILRNLDFYGKSFPEGVASKLSEFADSIKDNRWYFLSCVFAEALNFVNVVGQLFLINLFLGGEMNSKIQKFIEWDSADGYNPMTKVFPRVAMCTFYSYGSSGDVQKHDVICSLPMNALHEKIYVFLWIWFAILAALSGVVLIYRAVIAASSRFRHMVMRGRGWRFEHLDMTSNANDCLIFILLSRNMNSRDFMRAIKALDEEMKRRKYEFLEMKCEAL